MYPRGGLLVTSIELGCDGCGMVSPRERSGFQVPWAASPMDWVDVRPSPPVVVGVYLVWQ